MRVDVKGEAPIHLIRGWTNRHRTMANEQSTARSPGNVPSGMAGDEACGQSMGLIENNQAF
jgi:hypothetical protein